MQSVVIMQKEIFKIKLFLCFLNDYIANIFFILIFPCIDMVLLRSAENVQSFWKKKKQKKIHFKSIINYLSINWVPQTRIRHQIYEICRVHQRVKRRKWVKMG